MSREIESRQGGRLKKLSNNAGKVFSVNSGRQACFETDLYMYVHILILQRDADVYIHK
jgi:hypothetical protein